VRVSARSGSSDLSQAGEGYCRVTFDRDFRGIHANAAASRVQDAVSSPTISLLVEFL
jgi:hypothetical protein